MDNNIQTWLYDILNSINEIESYFADRPKEFLEFKNDLRTKRAVERDLEIIGEAMSRILQKQPDFKLTNARKIVDTRNRIIHGYDSISDESIWGIIINHLPLLKQEVDLLLPKL